MKKILLLGAGMSTSTLISYLLDHADVNDWIIKIGDQRKDIVEKKTSNHPRAESFTFDIYKFPDFDREIREASIVISMLPYNMHHMVARACLKNRRPMVSTSYVSQEIREMDKDARDSGIIILMESGLDPGIDHMSAMQVIDRIRENGDELIAFESATGGLVAPPYDNNPWRYKFTWAPRNVVLAGQGGARFHHNGKFKYIPYHRIFQRYETITIPGLGDFEVYPNRDSLRYQSAYGLYKVLTMFRGTIRRPGFCKAWDLLVQLGATDDSYIMDDSDNMTHREFINSFLAYNIIDPVETKLAHYLGIPEDSELMEKLRWLGLFDDTRIGVPDLTPARILQRILEQKWQLEPEDKDMIVMQNQFDYIHLGAHRKIISSMVHYGKDQVHTAMSDTVGLPAAISAKLILEGAINLKGVRIPVHKDIYEPVLKELSDLGIRFEEENIKLS